VSGQGGGRSASLARASALAWALLALAGASHAQPPEAAARAIFSALQVELELADIAQEAHASVAAPLRALPPGDALLLRAAIEGCFDPEALASLALAAFSARLDAGHAQAALGWLERPETQQLLARSAEQETPSAGRRGAHAAARRDALLLRFERHSGRAARSARHAELVFSSLLRAANPLLPPERRFRADEIDALLAAARGRFAPAAPDPAELRRRYAGISSRELESALAFLDSEAGVWLRGELDRALERALARAARTAAARLVGSLGGSEPPAPLLMALALEP
jgi:hypothetical protein